MSQPELIALSVTDARAALQAGAFSCQEYVHALVGQCEAEQDLNAFVAHDFDALLAAAEAVDAGGSAGGGMSGIPIAFKDNICTQTLSTGAATGALQGFVARRNAPVAQSLFETGALLGAKANMHELAFGITNNNAVTGATRNPYDQSLIPGGSSGGVAAAVAARMMPGGIGTDTGGSVRLPAALCGVIGFRPSVGRYQNTGIVPISKTRDTAGPIARCVADVRLLDAAMAGGACPNVTTEIEGIRIGVPYDPFFRNLEPGVAEESRRVLDLLSGAGAILVETDMNWLAELNALVGFPVALFEFAECLPRFLREHETSLTINDVFEGIGSPDVRAIVDSQLNGGAISEAAYRQALGSDRPRLQRAYASCFAEHSVEALIFPTSPVVARPIGDDETIELNGEQSPTFATYIRNTDPGGNAGVPGISLPTGLSPGGLPIGMELDGPQGADERLLSIAAAIEDIIAFSAAPVPGGALAKTGG